MNLSHVERYFADFLSAMESGGHIHLHEGETWGDVPANITLPKNLFIIGTVNIDETTYMFSPKVLDRANVIEFRLTENDLEGFLDNLAKPDMASLRAHGATMAGDFVTAALSDENKFSDTDYLRTVLLKFFSELKKIGAEFGYRSAYEISRFCGTLQQLSPDEGDFRDKDRMLDAAIIQKLLPKIHGSRKKLEPVFAVLIKLCLADSALDADSNLLSKLEQSPDEISNSDKVRFKLSLEKLLRMKKRAIQDGFTSFAEA